MLPERQQAGQELQPEPSAPERGLPEREQMPEPVLPERQALHLESEYQSKPEREPPQPAEQAVPEQVPHLFQSKHLPTAWSDPEVCGRVR